MSCAGVRFDAVIRPDWDEIDRRRARTLGPVADFQLMRTLQSLPCGIEVGWDRIDPIAAAVLDCAPAGVVEAGPAGVRRLLRPAVELTGVYAVSADAAALDRIGMMAYAAPAGLILRRRPERLEELTARAVAYGLGLALLDGGRLDVLTAPRWRARPGFNRARLLEAVFGRWLRGAADPAAQPPLFS